MVQESRPNTGRPNRLAQNPYINNNVANAANAAGNLIASSLVPIIFKEKTCNHIINGGLVFHISGCPK